MKCSECGAELVGVQSCKEYFDQMLVWDFSDFKRVGHIHHLTVLCYYLQHPHHYSKEGLEKALKILGRAIKENITDTELYQEESNVFSSSKRTWNVTGTEDNHGSYRSIIPWQITAYDITRNGLSIYPTMVKKWALSINVQLNEAGEID